MQVSAKHSHGVAGQWLFVTFKCIQHEFVSLFIRGSFHESNFWPEAVEQSAQVPIEVCYRLNVLRGRTLQEIFAIVENTVFLQLI